VWIFGTGYGDPSNLPTDTSDIKFYRGDDFEPSQNAIFDANQVDSLITNIFGLTKNNVKLVFIVPHFHLDHINQEFVSALVDSLNYPINSTQIFVHINDFIGATCNTPFCGMPPPNTPYKGAPYQPAWTLNILNLFQAIGDSNDLCNQPLISFNSASGNWIIRKGDTSHVSGSVNFDNSTLKYRILGAQPDGCFVSNNVTIFRIHGNIPNVTGIQNIEFNNSIKVYPNPANKKLIIEFIKNDNKTITISLINSLGEIILKRQNINTTSQYVIDTHELLPGLYLMQINASDGQYIDTKKIIIVD